MKDLHDDILDDALRHSKKEEKQEIPEAHVSKADMEKSSKAFVIVVIGIILVFAIIVGVKYFNKSRPLTIDELHQKNLAGKLKQDEGYVFKGYSFVFANGLWYTQLQFNNNLIDLPLHFDPKSVENVSVKGAINSSKFNEPDLYITFDPVEADAYIALSAAEMSLSLYKAIGRNPIGACTVNETDACGKRPIVTCDDEDKAVIYLEKGEGPEIEFDNNCIKVKGYGEDLVKATDRFLYYWYGVLK